MTNSGTRIYDNDIAADAGIDPNKIAGGVVTLTGAEVLTNKTFTSPIINTGVSGTAISLSATLTENSDTLLASQKAIKSYVDSKGNVTSTCCVSAYLGSAQAIAQTTTTLVNIDTETFDIGSNWDTTNKKFVAPATGYYFVSFLMNYTTLVNGERIIAFIYKEGGENCRAEMSVGNSNGGCVYLSNVIYLLATDEITFYTWHGGTQQSLEPGANFTFINIYRII